MMDDPRRRWLIRALAGGWLGAAWPRVLQAAPLGQVPAPLGPEQSVFRVVGDVRVNGEPADRQTRIGMDDHIETGERGELVAVVGSDALLIRRQSSVQLGLGQAKQALRLITGAMLSVFGRRTRQSLTIHTPIATIGVRGTGVYATSEPDRSYLCTCYGRTELAARGEPGAVEQITATHHDAPRYVLAQPREGRWIVPAPFIDHSDLELRMLEALVGREVPFTITDDPYLRPRRDY